MHLFVIYYRTFADKTFIVKNIYCWFFGILIKLWPTKISMSTFQSKILKVGILQNMLFRLVSWRSSKVVSYKVKQKVALYIAYI